MKINFNGLSKEFDTLVNKKTGSESERLEKIKCILQDMINSDEYGNYFETNEINLNLKMIEGSNLKNIKQLKTDIVNVFKERDRDASNKDMRENQLSKNQFNKDKPYN